MSTLTELKEYLVGDGRYLLNPDNNGKTVMLSGAWGSGKTHFWQNEIEREQKKVQGKTRKINKYSAKEYKAGLFSKLTRKKKACVYVSLYGKDNIEVLKSEILQKAYSGVIEKDTTPVKRIAAFSIGTKVLAGISILGVKVDAQDASDATKNHYDTKKIKEATEFLSDGGLICFDDFERKSKKIDLNDLFGFISQLAIDMNCKVVIILNSDVFEGEEANVFKTVKEKTVNKFFYFEPTRRELFDSIYDREDEKYESLNNYKEDLFNAIDETEELNARIYIQILDNCLEWIDKGYDSVGLQALAKTTIFFILTHKVLDYSEKVEITHPLYVNKRVSFYKYKLLEKYHKLIQMMSILGKLNNDILGTNFNDVKFNILNGVFSENSDGDDKYRSEIRQIVLKELKDNEKELSSIWKYGYRLYYMDTIDESTYNIIANFIKSGILPKKDKDPSS